MINNYVILNFFYLVELLSHDNVINKSFSSINLIRISINYTKFFREKNFKWSYFILVKSNFISKINISNYSLNVDFYLFTTNQCYFNTEELFNIIKEL